MINSRYANDAFDQIAADMATWTLIQQICKASISI